MKSNITFRVESELKEDFIKAAAANGTTATALFHEWMRNYINTTNGSTNNSTNAETNSTNTEDNSKESCTNSIDNETISTNTEQIKKLTARIDEMEERISAQDKAYQSLLDEAQQQREYMDGLSCPLYSNLSHVRHSPKAATSNATNASTPAEIAGEERPSPRQIDTVTGLTQHYPNGLNQKQLAERLNCSQSTITRQKSKPVSEWDEFCSNNDPLSCYWKKEGKRFYPTNAPTDPKWRLTKAHSS